jgi:3-oxoacyl-(acyl-carrier-protein) synthase
VDNIRGRKVAVVGMGGTFPTCKNLSEFSGKLFANKSLIRTFDDATAYEKQVRSTVAGFITEPEMDLEVIWDPMEGIYPETYIDKLNRIPDANLATADVGSIWSMLAAQEAIKMAGWSKDLVQSEQTGVVIGSGGSANTILRNGWHNFYVFGRNHLQPILPACVAHLFIKVFACKGFIYRYSFMFDHRGNSHSKQFPVIEMAARKNHTFLFVKIFIDNLWIL